MGAVFSALQSICSLIGVFFTYFMFMIEGTWQMVSTAFSVLKGLPAYMVFLPAGCIGIISGAVGIHILRTIFGR